MGHFLDHFSVKTRTMTRCDHFYSKTDPFTRKLCLLPKTVSFYPKRLLYCGVFYGFDCFRVPVNPGMFGVAVYTLTAENASTPLAPILGKLTVRGMHGGTGTVVVQGVHG